MKSQKGQALLIILLLMAVALTVGLAIVSRSVTDIGISQKEEESARAFSAAEAGIERALAGDLSGGTIGSGGYTITYQVNSLTQGGTNFFDFGGGKFGPGDTQTLWLVSHNEDETLSETGHFPATGKIDLCWGLTEAISDKTPAIEAILVYKSGTNYKVARAAVDPNTTRGNGFAAPNNTGACGLAFKTQLSLPVDLKLLATDIPYALRLKFFYNDQAQPLAVYGSSPLPNQGKCLESLATVTSSGVSRKIRQCQFYKSPPEIFDYVLYSDSELIK